MPVLMYHGRFVAKVKDGSKKQTIRRKGKRRIKVGDFLSHREWKGIAYALGAYQNTIKLSQCTRVFDLRILSKSLVTVDSRRLSAAERELLAVADGFDNWRQMFSWFSDLYAIPFEGDLIEWRNI